MKKCQNDHVFLCVGENQQNPKITRRPDYKVLSFEAYVGATRGTIDKHKSDVHM